MKHYKTYVVFAQKYGFAYCAWDNGMNGDFEILERDTKKWNEVKDILIFTSSQSPANPKLSIIQDTIIHLSWTNAVTDYDSIYVQRRLISGNYQRIVTLKGDTSSIDDINLFPNMYYYYRIIAHYNSGEDYYSNPVRIFLPAYVLKVRKLFLDEPAKIPGTVEAENFDIGGEGLTYHDADVLNITGAYRPNESVDIYDRLGNGYHIGNALPGEWYEYTIDVESDGEYKMDVYLASLEGGGTFQIKIGDAESDILTAPTSYSWLTTKCVSATMNLTTGEQIMRFTVIDMPLFNIDKLVFEINTSATDISPSPNTLFTVFQNQNRELVFNFQNNISVSLLQVYNITGSLIYSITNPGKNLKISTSGMPTGIYIIQVLSDNQKRTKQIVIN